MRKSMFDNAESTCIWSEETNSCDYQRVKFTVRAVLLISVLIACATAPINMLVDFLFQDIISAPSADEYKVELQARKLRQRVGRRLSTVAANARGALRNSISVARNTVAPILPTARTGLGSSPRPSFRRRFSSKHLLNQFTVPDTTIIKVPPAVMQSYASTSMILKDVFEHHNKDVVRKCHSQNKEEEKSDEVHTGDGMHHVASLYDVVESGAMHDDSGTLTSLETFYAHLHKQNQHLSGDDQCEFQERWGFDPSYGGTSNHSDIFGCTQEVTSGVSSKVRRILSCCQKENQTRQDILSKAMKETARFSNDKINKLKLASDVQIGLEIMHLFIIDLLG